MSDKTPLTPDEAAQILKISKYTVYELIKKGQLPAQRIGRQLRIDPDVLTQYIRGAVDANTLQPETKNIAEQSEQADVLSFSGSHDPAIELLIEFLKHSPKQLKVVPTFTGSLEGLIGLHRRTADFAGIHLWDEQTEQYNVPFIRYVLPGESVTLVNLVQRVQGWITAPGNPLNLQTWEDITKRNLRFVNRQKGSGTRLRLDSFLSKSDIDASVIKGYEHEESTHSGVAYRIANGEFDAGIGVKAAADKLGLGFVPLFHERYDLACLADTSRSEQWQQLVSVLGSPGFQHAVYSQGGYDTTLTGTYIVGGE